MYAVLQMFGLPSMPVYQFVVFLALIALALLTLGWIADMALGDGGYGVLLNSAVVMVGAVAGALLWQRLGYRLNMNAQAALALVAAGAGMVLLLVCAILRRWL